MSKSIVVMGAAGRMGGTIARLVRESEDLVLAGAVERAEKIAAAGDLGCPISADLDAVLASVPSAVIIDFTAPQASLATAKIAARHKASHVIGTTGFTAEQRAELEAIAKETPIFWSPNMSVGVNVLLKILPELTKLLGPDYDVEMTEIHHGRKKDSPSGTAVRLAECIADAKGWDLGKTGCYHREGIIGERPKEEIGVMALRGGDVVGVHTVYFLGPGERIELTHQAHSRENFATGALRAARWIVSQKPGKLYSMSDVF